MTKLSDTQRVILSQASRRDDGLAVPPERLPAAARQTVAKALIKQGLVSNEEAHALSTRDAWQIDGQPRLLRITDDGLRAIGVEPDNDTAEPAVPSRSGSAEMPALPAAPQGASLAALPSEPPSPSGEAPEGPQHAPVSPRGPIGYAAGLRMAAVAVLASWDTPARDGLNEAIAALRATLATPRRSPGSIRLPRDPATPRQPRTGTKQEAVLALFRRDEGATVAQIINATGWQSHTVRGFLAGLKRKGIEVEVLERVRQVGPNKQGAKGSYSIYRIVASAAAASVEAC